MEKRKKAELVKNYLFELIKEPKSELEYFDNFSLLVAVILSAQCTDKRVNVVTKELFKKYKTPEDFSKLNTIELEKEIHSCGFYRNKAKNIINASIMICSDFNGKVPEKFEDLLKLSGVGRKTANVMLSVGFNKDAFAVDTHILRIANRLNFTSSNNPDIVERDLKRIFNKKDWSNMHYLLVLFGRYYCTARNPKCESCKIQNICNYYKNKV